MRLSAPAQRFDEADAMGLEYFYFSSRRDPLCVDVDVITVATNHPILVAAVLDACPITDPPLQTLARPDRPATFGACFLLDEPEFC